MSQARRRRPLSALGAFTLANPLVSLAQQPLKVHRVALVFFAAPTANMADPEPAERLARVCVHALRDRDRMRVCKVYVDGQDVGLRRIYDGLASVALVSIGSVGAS